MEESIYVITEKDMTRLQNILESLNAALQCIEVGGVSKEYLEDIF